MISPARILIFKSLTFPARHQPLQRRWRGL